MKKDMENQNVHSELIRESSPGKSTTRRSAAGSTLVIKIQESCEIFQYFDGIFNRYERNACGCCFVCILFSLVEIC